MKNAGIVPAENEAAEIVSIEQTHTIVILPPAFCLHDDGTASLSLLIKLNGYRFCVQTRP